MKDLSKYLIITSTLLISLLAIIYVFGIDSDITKEIDWNQNNEIVSSLHITEESNLNSADQENNTNSLFEDYRDRTLEIFNITLEQYYNLDQANQDKLHDYIYAIWGYENGSLTQEEALEIIKPNSPDVIFYGMLRHDDEEFRAKFTPTVHIGEKATRIWAYLDGQHNFFVKQDLKGFKTDRETYDWYISSRHGSPDFYRLRLHEALDPYDQGHIRGTNEWVGDHWGYLGYHGIEFTIFWDNAVYLDAYVKCSGYGPNINGLDNWMKLIIGINYEYFVPWPICPAMYGCHETDTVYIMYNYYFDAGTGMPQLIRIDDDDTAAPEITITNINFNYDSVLLDSKSELRVSGHIVEQSGWDVYLEIIGTSSEVIYGIERVDPGVLYFTYYLSKPSIPGTYTLRITCWDWDNDIENDRKWAAYTKEFEFLDDDTTKPLILDYIIPDSITDGQDVITIKILASDDSDINKAVVRFNEIDYESTEPQSDGYYYVDIPNPGILDTYNIDITVWDNDIDRESDQEWTTIETTFEVTLDDDTTPPEFTLEYDGGTTDGDLGQLDLSFSDPESDAIAKLSITGPNGFSFTKNYALECTDAINMYDLGISDMGLYTITLNVENNDEDWGSEDEETDFKTITLFIEDDDRESPIITYDYTGDFTDGNPGTIIFTATDNSGIAGDSTITYIVPSEPGTYYFPFTATDGDNDRPVDSLSATLTIPITIDDDDKDPPEITYVYTGDFTDGNPGTITFTATDPSGISGDYSITYDVLSDLGTQFFTFTVTDLDNDRLGDSLSASLTIPITIDDDDKDLPEITYVYTGDFTDGNPGTITFTATDPSGINGDLSITYGVLSDLGTQFFTFTAADADNDRLGDSLSSTLTVPIMIDDDDTEPPSILNLIIQDEIYYIQILFDVFDDNSGDDEGVSLIIILIDGEIALTYESTDAEMSFDFIIPNEWAMNIGHHNVLIEVWDADNDRIGDSSFSVGSGTFLIIFEEMKQYIIWEIDQFIVAIQESPDELWGDPTEQRKNAMTNKLLELRELVLSDIFEDAYEKLLHDIKPLLTGLKTDENNIDYGNGVFKNAWVIFEDFEIRCNEILSHLQILIAENY